MTTDERITRLEMQVANLNSAYLQSQRNQIPITDTVYDTANKVVELTPYTETKTAYIGDTECTFSDVPEGNLTVYLTIPYTVERDMDRVTVYFEELAEVTNITISIN